MSSFSTTLTGSCWVTTQAVKLTLGLNYKRGIEFWAVNRQVLLAIGFRLEALPLHVGSTDFSKANSRLLPANSFQLHPKGY
ncbi:hypothetical protein BV372_10550 [Nostoc sp. T09]|nr:hypothetical protein BV372_10550 [Nostoc sp. T09]